MEKGPIHQIHNTKESQNQDIPIKGLVEPLDPIGQDLDTNLHQPGEPEATYEPAELQFIHWKQQRQPIS